MISGGVISLHAKGSRHLKMHFRVQLFLGIVKPLMANQPFVINVKGEEKVWLSSMTKGEIDEYGVVIDDKCEV